MNALGWQRSPSKILGTSAQRGTLVVPQLYLLIKRLGIDGEETPKCGKLAAPDPQVPMLLSVRLSTNGFF